MTPPAPTIAPPIVLTARPSPADIVRTPPIITIVPRKTASGPVSIELPVEAALEIGSWAMTKTGISIETRNAAENLAVSVRLSDGVSSEFSALTVACSSVLTAESSAVVHCNFKMSILLDAFR